MLHQEDEFFEEHVGLLLAYTLHESPFRWVLSLMADTVHSFEHLCDINEDTFYHFDPDHLDWKMLQQWSTPHEPLIDFWQRFCDFHFQARRSEMKFSYPWDKFEYCLKKSTCPKRNLEIKPLSTFFIDGAAQSHVDVNTVSTDCLPSSHSIAIPLPSDAKENTHTRVHPSHSPNITSPNFRIDLVVSPSSSHMHSCLRPPSLHVGVSLNDVVLCLSIPDSSLVANKEEPIDGVDVAQPTCTVIHEEYEWEHEHQHLVKDESLPSQPHPFFPNLFGEPAIHDFACVSSSMYAPIVGHSHDSPDVSPPFDNGGDKLLIEYLLDPSSIFSINTMDDFVHFSSTPLFDVFDHEDATNSLIFLIHGSRDPFNFIFYHDHESIAVDLSKPLVYDDLCNDEVETPKTVDALQPKLMVMSSPCSLGVSLTSSHEIFQSPKAPHHSSVCIEDPSHSHITLPPLELHDPITHALEESYIASTRARCKLSLFLSFACMSHSVLCLCFKVACSVTQHHDKSTDYPSCTSAHLCLVGTLKHEV